MRTPLLALHITGGIVGLLSGALAMIYRKGSKGHRLAGNVFVVAMLTMGVCGSTLALMKHQIGNVFGGLLTSYLVATAWLAGRGREKQTSILDWGCLALGLAMSLSMLTLGTLVADGRAPKQPGVPLAAYFFMGTVPLLAAMGDIRMLMRGGVSGTARLVRHLWRMCFGLFMATGSFFLGQQQVIPAVVRKQYLLVPLGLLPLPLLIYWLMRVSWTRGRGSLLRKPEGARA